MSHLTREQRYTISSMFQNGYNQKEIALVIKNSLCPLYLLILNQKNLMPILHKHQN